MKKYEIEKVNLHEISVFQKMVDIKKMMKLNDIINYKRHFHQYGNNPYLREIVLDKITYIELLAGHESLGKLESKNGRPFTKKQVFDFINKQMNLNFYNHLIKVANDNPKDYRKNVDYSLAISYDSTKSKTLHAVYLYNQEVGSDRISKYEMTLKIGNKSWEN